MASKGELVQFKAGVNGIDAPQNYGIFLNKYRNKQKVHMVKLYTIKGTIEIKNSSLEKSTTGKRVQLRDNSLPPNKELKSRLTNWIAEIADQNRKIGEIEERVGVLTERKLWEKLIGSGEEFTSDEILEIWYELDAVDISKDKRKEMKALLDSCKPRGVGYLDYSDKRWHVISKETRKAVTTEISRLGNLRNRMFHLAEVPSDDDPDEFITVRLPLPWEDIEFVDYEDLVEKLQHNMAYFVEHDRWREDGLGGTHVHTLDGFSLRTFTSYLAEDWMNEGKSSYSDAFVKFLIRSGYWTDTQAIITISKRRVLLEKDFAWDTPDRIEEIAATYTEPGEDPANFEGRTDLRELDAYTIDPPTAKDFDDAVSLIEYEDGYVLYVHIADVAHYVDKDSTLDLHARKRATSVYLPTRTLPMLPHHLSDNLCSLREQVPRLAMTVEIHYDLEGNKSLDDCEIHNSVIEVTENLNYDYVNKAIKRGEEPFVQLNEFAKLLQKHRRGLKLMTDEIRLEVGGQMSLSTKTASDSTQMVETFMVAANETVAEILHREKLPVIYRNHPLPDKELVHRFNVHAKVIGIDCAIEYPDLKDKTEEEGSSLLDLLSQDGGNISFSIGVGGSADFLKDQLSEQEEEEVDLGKPLVDGLAQLDDEKQEAILAPFREVLGIVEQIKDKYLKKLGYLIVLRTLSRAFYAPGNMGHFGLGSTHYLHFTSPIRRYPDVIAHRVCKAMIAEQELVYTAEEIEDLAFHCTGQSEIAEKLERIIVGAGFSFLTRNPNYSENKQGIITSISGGGVFVMLPNGIEARIPLSQMTDGATFVDEFDSMCFMGSKGKFDLKEEITPDNWRELLEVDEDNPVQILAKLGDKMSIRFIGWDHIEGKVTAAPVSIEAMESSE